MPYPMSVSAESWGGGWSGSPECPRLPRHVKPPPPDPSTATFLFATPPPDPKGPEHRVRIQPWGCTWGRWRQLLCSARLPAVCRPHHNRWGGHLMPGGGEQSRGKWGCDDASMVLQCRLVSFSADSVWAHHTPIRGRRGLVFAHVVFFCSCFLFFSVSFSSGGTSALTFIQQGKANALL